MCIKHINFIYSSFSECWEGRCQYHIGSQKCHWPRKETRIHTTTQWIKIKILWAALQKILSTTAQLVSCFYDWCFYSILSPTPWPFIELDNDGFNKLTGVFISFYLHTCGILFSLTMMVLTNWLVFLLHFISHSLAFYWAWQWWF